MCIYAFVVQRQKALHCGHTNSSPKKKLLTSQSRPHSEFVWNLPFAPLWRRQSQYFWCLLVVAVMLCSWNILWSMSKHICIDPVCVCRCHLCVRFCFQSRSWIGQFDNISAVLLHCVGRLSVYGQMWNGSTENCIPKLHRAGHHVFRGQRLQ